MCIQAKNNPIATITPIVSIPPIVSISRKATRSRLSQTSATYLQPKLPKTQMRPPKKNPHYHLLISKINTTFAPT